MNIITREQYAEQFYRNLKIMSRTANGVLDTCASTTKQDSLILNDGKKAKNIAHENAERAIDFIYDNRDLKFGSPEEVSDFLLRLAAIVNDVIVREDRLFRNGADSEKYKYIRIRDIPEIWKWFTERLCYEFGCSCSDVEETAAFCEFLINFSGHFFSDGCGRISMLAGMYVFMRCDRPCVEYRSREEYYSIAGYQELMDAETFMRTFPDKCACEFIRYYKSLCRAGDHEYNAD